MIIRSFYFISFILLLSVIATAQNRDTSINRTIIDFISDTQQPMLVEKLFLRSNNNRAATSLLFAEIIKTKPQRVYMLGDVVALGFDDHKWRKVDHFLADCNKENIQVFGLLGNHDVMGREKKGERNFNKRFPQNVRTGYVSIIDSIAIILLNSNFSTLSATEKSKQNQWYQSTLNILDNDAGIKVIIVACHHSPYSNSQIVGSSTPVQENFVMPYIKSKKAQLFITGHSHNFEHFKKMGKDFLVIGGGGGLHQPLDTSSKSIPDLAYNYKPLFHYLSLYRVANSLQITSHYLSSDFKTFGIGGSFQTHY